MSIGKKAQMDEPAERTSVGFSFMHLSMFCFDPMLEFIGIGHASTYR